MLAAFQGAHARKSVRVFAGAHDHGIKLASRVEELSEVGEFLCIRVLRGGCVEVPAVDIAERDDVLGTDAAHVAPTAASGANDGDIQLVVEVLAPEEGGRRGEASGDRKHG